MREIEADCPGFKKIQEFRNQIAHSPLTEIKDEDDVDDLFLVIEEAVNTLFKDKALRQQRRKWRDVLQQIRHDDIGKVEPQTKGFQEQVAREKEATFKAENVITYNFNFTGPTQVGKNHVLTRPIAISHMHATL